MRNFKAGDLLRWVGSPAFRADDDDEWKIYYLDGRGPQRMDPKWMGTVVHADGDHYDVFVWGANKMARIFDQPSLRHEVPWVLVEGDDGAEV